MSFYEGTEPFDTGTLKSNDGAFDIYFERIGNPEGTHVVFLHGGPGGGIKADYRKFF